MVDRATDLRVEWLVGKRRVGVTAGASAPAVLVQEVVERLRELGATAVEEMEGTPESVVFPLPKTLLAGS